MVRPARGEMVGPGRGERGSAVPLLLALIAIVMVTVAGLGRLGTATLQRARADAAADVTALAVVVGDRAAADRVAEASGATLIEVVDRPGGVSQVLVERGGVRGVAAAAPAGAPR